MTELCERVVRERVVRERVVCERGRRADGSGRECTTEKQEPHTKIWGKKCPITLSIWRLSRHWNTISSDESCWSALISHQNCTQKMCVSHLKTNPFVAFPGFFKTNLMYQLDGRGG